MPTVHARAFRRAADILGGAEELAKVLHTPSFVVKLWMQGRGMAPLSAFFKAVDVIYQHAATATLTQPDEQRTGADQRLSERLDC